MRSSATWSGYAPWAETVHESRTEFTRVARGFWLLPEAIPPTQRDDVALLYCFCRQLDDLVDEQPDRAQARAALAAFRSELEGRTPARPLVAAFVAGARRSGLPLACAGHLLTGMECDLEPVRVPDDAALLRYAYRVSAAVGLMLAPLLGVHGARALQRVVDLGLALQISNVLLGVRSDAGRDRVYLPATRLSAEGLAAQDVLARPADGRLRPVLRGLVRLADRYYRSAEQGARHVPLRYRHGVLLLGRAYAGLGRRAARGEAAPAVPAALPLRVKLGQLLSLAGLALKPEVLGWGAPAPHDPALHAALDPAWLGVHT